jgi:hypothetical protein
VRSALRRQGGSLVRTRTLLFPILWTRTISWHPVARAKPPETDGPLGAPFNLWRLRAYHRVPGNLTRPQNGKSAAHSVFCTAAESGFSKVAQLGRSGSISEACREQPPTWAFAHKYPIQNMPPKSYHIRTSRCTRAGFRCLPILQKHVFSWAISS